MLTVAWWFVLYGTSIESLRAFVDPSDAGVRWMAHLIGEVVMSVVFIVAWHRLVLLGSRDSDQFVQFRFGRREVIYLLYGALFLLPIFFVMVVADPWVQEAENSNVEWILFIALAPLVALIGLFGLAVRCTLIFPAIAVDRNRGLATAWRELKGSTWRLTGAFGLTLGPFFIAEWMFESLIRDISASEFSAENDYLLPVLALYLGYQFVNFLTIALMTTAESFAFRHLTGWAPPTSSERLKAPA